MFTDTPPIIDGDISDAVWAAASVIDDFHEVEPTEYAPAKDQVRVRVLYDEDNLYVSADITVQNVADITAFKLAQGSDIQEEDRLKVVLDPYNNKRTGYDFRINPNGVREEALFPLIGRPNTDWDGIWDGRARINDRGWTAEFAIPFKTINFDPAITDWGISFATNIPARNEQIAWTSQSRLIRPGTLGLMTGVDRARQGMGLDIKPSLSLRQARDYAADVDQFDIEPSIDVFYKITPQLTAALTVNTDFSAAEVDDRVVNLERFSVFFPEKRSFFLQDADIFSFAGLEGNGVPFFSRRIGIDENQRPVDIIGGAKLTGRIGPVNVGILDVVQDAGMDDVNLFVGRAYLNVLDLSTLGLIVTNGSPDGEVSNSVVGADFNYINRDMFGSKGLSSNVWYLQSDTEGVPGDEAMYGAYVEVPRADGFFGWLWHQQIGQNYAPALGFVNRSGIREYSVMMGYRFFPANSLLQQLDVSGEVYRAIDFDGNTETEYSYIEPLDITTSTNDEFKLRVYREREVLGSPFEISNGVVIDSGDYSWTGTELSATTGDQRRVFAAATVAKGDFYDGERLQLTGELAWQPSRYFSTRAGIEYNDVELRAGSFITRLVTLRTDVALSSTWSWSTLAQYDNDSDLLSFNSRLTWIPRAGQEMILVANHGSVVDDTMPGRDRVFRSRNSDVVLKIAYTLRY